MELDLQSLFKLHVCSFTYWLRPRNPLPLHLGSFGSKDLVQKSSIGDTVPYQYFWYLHILHCPKNIPLI